MAWFVRFSDNWLKINERQFRHRWHRLKCVAFKVMTYVSFAPCRKEDVMCGMFYLGSNIKWPLLINYWRKDNMLANSFKILCSPFHSCALWLYLGYILSEKRINQAIHEQQEQQNTIQQMPLMDQELQTIPGRWRLSPILLGFVFLILIFCA
jgi:hypothetical protein